MKHGTRYAYVHGPCRCDACRAANSAYSRELQARLATRVPRVHGTVSTYKNWSCRCDVCTLANTMATRKVRARS